MKRARRTRKINYEESPRTGCVKTSRLIGCKGFELTSNVLRFETHASVVHFVDIKTDQFTSKIDSTLKYEKSWQTFLMTWNDRIRSGLLRDWVICVVPFRTIHSREVIHGPRSRLYHNTFSETTKTFLLTFLLPLREVRVWSRLIFFFGTAKSLVEASCRTVDRGDSSWVDRKHFRCFFPTKPRKKSPRIGSDHNETQKKFLSRIFHGWNDHLADILVSSIVFNI